MVALSDSCVHGQTPSSQARDSTLETVIVPPMTAVSRSLNRDLSC